MSFIFDKSKQKKVGSVQAILLIIIILIVGGLVGAALVYLATTHSQSPAQTKTQIVYPSGTTLPTFAPIVDVIKPAVVNVYTEQKIRSPFRQFHQFDNNPFNDFLGDDFFRRFFGDVPKDYKQTSLGSGVLVDSGGYILTNNHVIDQADKISIKLADGTEYKNVEIIGKDPKTDLALLKIKTKVKLPYAVLGDSSQLKVGDWVLAVGNPLGFSESVSHGIISALGRRDLRVAEYEDFIQTDAAINPGNSGGPLVNLKGEVIGITTVIATQTGNNIGIGFAIPSNLVKSVFTELKTHGKVVRGWLGVGLENLTDYHIKKFGVANGVRISAVAEGSPAAKAGVKVDDIVTEYDGEKIKNIDQLRKLVSSTKIGKAVTIKLVRNKQPMTVKVVIGEMPADTSGIFTRKSEIDLGITVENVTPEIARKLRLSKATGVIVTGVEQGSYADSAGLQRGDVILEINERPIKNAEDYDSVMSQIQKGDKINLRVNHDGAIIYISIETD